MARKKRGKGSSGYLPVLLLLGILAGAVSLMWLASLGPWLPSPQAMWLGPVALALALAGTAAIGWAIRWRKSGALFSSGDWGNRVFVAMLLVGSGFALHLLLRFCLPLLLHCLADPQPATQVEPVLVRESASRRGSCGNAALLPGDGYLLHRRLCGLSPEQARALHESGRVELRGRRSYFGMQVEDYAAVPLR